MRLYERFVFGVLMACWLGSTAVAKPTKDTMAETFLGQITLSNVTDRVVLHGPIAAMQPADGPG